MTQSFDLVANHFTGNYLKKKHQQSVTYLQHFLCEKRKKDQKCFSPQGAEFYSPLNLFDHSFSILNIMLAECIL